MTRCEYKDEFGVQCPNEAMQDINLCKKHFNLKATELAEIDTTFPIESFGLLHLTTYYGLRSILEQNEIVPSETLKNVFFSFIFPGDKIKPFRHSKDKYVFMLLNPKFFETCSNKRMPDGTFGNCFFTPFWATGKRLPVSYKYKYRKGENTLKENLNNIYEIQRQYDYSSDYGLTFENELVISEKVSNIKKYIEGIYIPEDFMPEYDDEFDLDEFKAEFPQYYFIDPSNPEDKKLYGKFIDFKAFREYEEPPSEEENGSDEEGSESESDYESGSEESEEEEEY
jgi:hypothetical protein